MKYMGSKNRHAKHLLPLILEQRHPGQCYVEPFVGGANMIDKVDGWRIGADSNPHMIALLKALENGWLPPETVNEETYNKMKASPGMYDSHILAYVATQLSYGAKWFGGYRRDSIGKRDYSLEAFNNVKNQAAKLRGIEFTWSCYSKLPIPNESIVYCDPPYASTTKYRDRFNHSEFWAWCEIQVKMGHTVFVSEYAAPDGWVPIWSKEVSNSLTRDTGSKKGVECLFAHQSQRAL